MLRTAPPGPAPPDHAEVFVTEPENGLFSVASRDGARARRDVLAVLVEPDGRGHCEMNTLYRGLILARARTAIDAARAVTGIGHQGLKGQLREIVVRDLLQPLFPSDVGLGTGEIITAFDQRSSQQDVVVFDRSIVPPILLEGTTGVFPVESVLFAIEIQVSRVLL